MEVNMAEEDSSVGERSQIRIMTTHVWKAEDTYANVAEKYYGSSKNWRFIYDYNKEIIGDNPNSIQVGAQIIIPVLPDEMK
jgi:nucleoid-associated protein YgaU